MFLGFPLIPEDEPNLLMRQHDMRFEADKSLKASSRDRVNTTFRFVEFTEQSYQIRIYFNTFHLLDMDNTGNTILSKDAIQNKMSEDLFVTRLANNSGDDYNRTVFELTMKPFHIPAHKRLNRFVEKVLYKVRFMESNRTYEFSTDYLNNCETIVMGGGNY